MAFRAWARTAQVGVCQHGGLVGVHLSIYMVTFFPTGLDEALAW